MHKGKVVAEKGEYKVIDCENCGFKHLNPIPSEEEIIDFYKKRYFNLVKKGGRAPEMTRLMRGGKEAELELKWLKSTLYNDINHILKENVPNGSHSLCDIGCGTGDFLKYMMSRDWKGIGIEPSYEGGQNCSKSEFTVYNLSLEKFMTVYPEHKDTFDVITLLNVLEHVPDPVDVLQNAKKLLKPHTGLICIRVPNDFNELQIYTQKKLKKHPWWVAIPDHINYFNCESLQKLLISIGFDIIHITADFPMEFFLLMGDDYIGNPEIGSLCHRKRVSFEMLISDALRWKIYQNLSEIDVGRNCLVFAKIK